jgi:hypothetical protein
MSVIGPALLRYGTRHNSPINFSRSHKYREDSELSKSALCRQTGRGGFEMAERNDQGTGKHPHKSTEEPYPHHEGKSTQGSGGHQANGSQERGGSEHNREKEEGQQGRGGQQSGSSDLKEREYRDAQGNIHHHTRTYEEQHGKK